MKRYCNIVIRNGHTRMDIDLDYNYVYLIYYNLNKND